ncbi:MAG: cob(I)yrinic acid a,c-diamide adenosyltransferase [bacterium]|nr:cob(I)yrinic acid a,c-diamide adenosyltransferase [bacterium]
MDHGLLIVYTGNGKGKTTAALGMALRASGYGWKVAVLQFVKEEAWPSGERAVIRKNLKNIHIEALGSGFVGIMGDKKPRDVHRKKAQYALKKVGDVLGDETYQLVILDELLGALRGRLVMRKDVESILRQKPEPTHLVLTGRHAPKWLVARADLVTEMKEIKHPFSTGRQATKGIDF